MPGRECYHCKQWIEEGASHDCWTTTESALTRDLSENLREAYDRSDSLSAGPRPKTTTRSPKQTRRRAN
jgi:hypothetical protein